MYRLVYITLDLAVVAVFAVPAGLIFQHFFTERANRRKWLFLLFSLYLAAVFSAVGIPNIRSLVFDPAVNLIPFLDAVNSPVSYIRNELLNVLLFVPLGVFLPILWSRDVFTCRRTVIFAMALSVLIELSQLFTFRLTDVDDIITNTLGAALGYELLLYCKTPCNINLHVTDGKMSAWRELFLLLFYILFIMFFIKPYIW